MATRLIGTDSDVPRLPQLVIDASQGVDHADVAPGDIGATTLTQSKAYTDAQLAAAVLDPATVAFADNAQTIAGTLTGVAVSPAGLAYERPYLDARSYGVVGDGVVDDGPALNAFLAAAAGKVAVISSGFTCRTTVPINVASSTTLRGYGATLINDCPGVNDRLLRFIGVSSVVVEGLRLDGRKASFAAATEFRHNVYIEGSTRVTLRDLYSFDAKGDGYYVGIDSAVSAGIVMEGCTAETSHRNGLSISSVDGFMATDCRFNRTSGTSPQAGIDIEPNTATSICRDIAFVNCQCDGNVSAGAIAQTILTATQQRNVSFVGCSFTDATDATVGRGLWLRNPINFRVVGCHVQGNAAEGVWLDSSPTTSLGTGPTTISDCAVVGNGREGIQVWNSPNVTIANCAVTNNSTVAANARDGISISPTVNTSGFQVIGCWLDGASQRYGLRTSGFAKGLTVIGNSYGTMGTGTSSFTDEQGSRFRLEQDGTMLSSMTAAAIRLRFREAADANDRLIIRSDGEMRFGDGAVAGDVRLFRQGPNELRTVSKFNAATLYTAGEIEIDGAINHDGTTIGFYNTTPITKPAVTGAKASNAALASLLTQLAALGLITDSTTA